MQPTPPARTTGSAPPPAAARSTAAARRDEILDAATVEFAAAGLHGTSTEAVARRAGVSQPYVFRLFGTKLSLFLATVERCYDRLVAAFAEAAADADRTGVHPLDAMGLRYIELLEDREQLRLQMHMYAACGETEVREAVTRRYGELYGFVERTTQATTEQLQRFFATGMLLNVAASMDLLRSQTELPWAARLLALDLPTGRTQA